jgi:hypothetical protein
MGIRMACQGVNSAPGSGGARPARKPDCSIQLSHSRAVSHPSLSSGTKVFNNIRTHPINIAS